MRALGCWLMLVGSLRLASVWFGFFNIWALRIAVYSQTTMTEVHGRTFGVWTLLTCTLCFLCANNLENKPLYVATFLSFIYAIGHFLTEYFIYQTMAISNLSTVGFFAVCKFRRLITSVRDKDRIISWACNLTSHLPSNSELRPRIADFVVVVFSAAEGQWELELLDNEHK
ncbi:hypothetical protein V2J09_007469 [Rumex salicifolius]